MTTRAQRAAAAKAAATRKARRLPRYAPRDFEAERDADFRAFVTARLGPVYSLAAAQRLEVDWYADAMERRPDLFDPYYGHPFASDQESYFASGSNHAGEIAGLARSGWNVGVAVDRLNAASERALLDEEGLLTRIFVDSGAFAERLAEIRGKPRPITPQEWARRLCTYRRLAEKLRDQLWLVAPDKVGDQVETLNRQLTYRAEMRELARLGANVIVPVQKGPTPLSVAWLASRVILGPGRWIAGVPMKQDATTLPELVEFVEAAQPAAVHLLGLGPSSDTFREAVDAVRAVRPGIVITCDSVLLRRLAGRDNGPGGAPRALTAARDEAVRRGITEVVAQKTFSAQEVARALTREEQRDAELLGWRDPELSDPVSPLHDVQPPAHTERKAA